MKFERTEVWGFKHALRGMRNPLNSWNKADTLFQVRENDVDGDLYSDGFETPDIGPNDLGLAQRLISGGSEHRKFLRQIMVSVDITAPLYWWKEFDTYKVGTTANSTSTMHKLASNPITLDCFETDDYDGDVVYADGDIDKWVDDKYVCTDVENLVNFLEMLRVKYLETKDKRIWKELVRWLPEGWLQTRTVTMNYENLRTMYHQRKEHKLNEWSGKDDPTKTNFIAWVEALPYAKEFIID